MSSLTVFLTTWNTGLQGSKAQSQDLTSWLLPVLQQTSDGASLPAGSIPDIYAIGVQELLPLHLALAGLSATVLMALTSRIESLLSAHATSLSPNKTAERYVLVSRESHVGVALWIFARESTMKGRLGKALTSQVGLWHLGMGNKGAVGVRLPVRRGEKEGEGGWEILTFVCAHLEAYDNKIARRNGQYQSILSSLLFRGSDPLGTTAQIHHTSHLFIMGDLNYRLLRLPSGSTYPSSASADLVALEREREELVELDTLKKEQAAGRVFGGLREGDLTRFAPTYKRVVGQVQGYSRKRIPGYTDRILFASHTDPGHLFSPQSISGSSTSDDTTQIVHLSSTEESTLSDHKPVHAVLVLPPIAHSAPAPHLAPLLPGPPPPHPPRPRAISTEELLWYRITGTILDKAVGWPWTVLVLLGFGNVSAGMGVGTFLAMVWGVWWSGVWSG